MENRAGHVSFGASKRWKTAKELVPKGWMPVTLRSGCGDNDRGLLVMGISPRGALWVRTAVGISWPGALVLRVFISRIIVLVRIIGWIKRCLS
jgi:hypothetical protein